MSRIENEEDLWNRVVDRKETYAQQSISTFPEPYGNLYDFLRRISAAQKEVKSPTLENRVETLEKQVQQLMQKNVNREKSNKVDAIYEIFKEEMEKTCMGKIVAIDIDSKTIVGVGTTITEAYKDARKKSKKQSFSYKRVGSPYVYRLR